MCVVSMVMDHYSDKWQDYLNKPVPLPYIPIAKPAIEYNTVILPTQEEVDEFYKLLERAREYDKKHNEPNCELNEKKEKLLKIAKELGIEIIIP